MEPTRRRGLCQSVKEFFGPAHYWRHKPLDGFHQLVGGAEPVPVQDDDILDVRWNRFRLRDRIDFPDIADLVFQTRAFVSRRVVCNEPDTAAFTSDPTDTSAATAPCFGYDKNFHRGVGFGVKFTTSVPAARSPCSRAASSER